MNSGNLTNHWSRNWGQFKDPLCYLCLRSAVVSPLSLTQEVVGSSHHFNKILNSLNSVKVIQGKLICCVKFIKFAMVFKFLTDRLWEWYYKYLKLTGSIGLFIFPLNRVPFYFAVISHFCGYMKLIHIPNSSIALLPSCAPYVSHQILAIIRLINHKV